MWRKSKPLFNRNKVTFFDQPSKQKQKENEKEKEKEETQSIPDLIITGNSYFRDLNTNHPYWANEIKKYYFGNNSVDDKEFYKDLPKNFIPIKCPDKLIINEEIIKELSKTPYPNSQIVSNTPPLNSVIVVSSSSPSPSLSLSLESKYISINSSPSPSLSTAGRMQDIDLDELINESNNL